ncbi:MAG: hypothetical protein IPN76_03980 [Saprospiraceae bacterium]|nr:hypothetical protein [Saprospiraceae bacterium]
MKNDEHTFFKIQDYLAGKLTPAEAAAFEQDIAADHELAETVEMQRFEGEAIDLMIADDLRQQIKGWETAPPKGLADSKPSNRQWLWPGLGLVALLVIGGLFFWKNEPAQTDPTPPIPTNTETQKEAPVVPPTTPSTPIAGQTDDKQPDKTLPKNGYDEKRLALAEASFGTPTALADDNVRSPSGQPVADPLKEWKALLRQAKPDYQKAITGLLKAPQNEAAESLLAYAYFKDKQFDKAAAIYQRLAANEKLTPAQKDEAEWHLLMSLLPDRANKQKVDDLLSKMAKPDNYHEYQQQANALKEKLAKG